MITEAIILAGGLGTRLRDAVPDLPKCMAPVNGIPFLKYVIDYFAAQGIEKFIYALGYKSETITSFLQSKMPALQYEVSLEETPLGTGGAIKKACTLATQKSVLILNGDTLFKIELDNLAGVHTLTGAHCSLSLKPMNNFDRYGVVDIADDLTVKSFLEKKHYEEGLINGGVYALHVEKFLAESLPETFSFEKDYLEALYSKRCMLGIEQDGYFIDIGIPEDYERAQRELA